MELEVVIEIPRGSFLKRGSTGELDFVSPLPCPFNYGSVRSLIGTDGDYLDAIVLGPRMRRGARVCVSVHGAIGLRDRGLYDDKLVCSQATPGRFARWRMLQFMTFYGLLKRLLNLLRRRPGSTFCEGWTDVQGALSRARPVQPASPLPPRVPF